MSGRVKIGLAVVIAIIILLKGDSINIFKSKRISVVSLDGVIEKKLMTQFIADMEEVKEEGKSHSVIVVLNSGGGSPQISEEIYTYINDFKKDIPVYMYIEEVAASGGYYIASAANKIHSNQNAIVGSIGVILQKYEFSKLAETIGVNGDNIEMGEYKAPMSILEPITDKSKQYLIDNLMKPMYDNFRIRVAEGRKMTPEQLEPFTEGKIFLASEVKGTLVDELTTLIQLKNELKDKYKCDKFVDIDNKKVSLLKRLGFTIKLDIPQLKNEISFK